METQVTIKVRAETAASLHRGGRLDEVTGEFVRTLGDLGLWPMRFDDDPWRSPFITLSVPTREEADRVIERLLTCAAVEAAFLKPPDEPPAPSP